MATFNSLELGGTNTNARTYPVAGVGLGGRSYHSARGEYTTLATLATADVVNLFYLPIRARIWGGFLKTAQLDTSTGLTLSVGIAGTSTLFWNASTIGRTAGGGVDSTMAFSGRDYVTTARTLVFLTATAGATTGANGQIVVHLQYSVEEPI